MAPSVYRTARPSLRWSASPCFRANPSEHRAEYPRIEILHGFARATEVIHAIRNSSSVCFLLLASRKTITCTRVSIIAADDRAFNDCWNCGSRMGMLDVDHSVPTLLGSRSLYGRFRKSVQGPSMRARRLSSNQYSHVDHSTVFASLSDGWLKCPYSMRIWSPLVDTKERVSF